MLGAYIQKFQARWGDMDFNAHMANTAYLDLAANERMLFFEEHGFSMRDFEKLHIGPVVMKDEIEYYHEIRLLETIDVHLFLAGISEDGSRMRMRNIFYNAAGKKAAAITSTAGWMDLRKRSLVSPPAQLHQAMLGIARTEDFEILPSSAR
ncbi:MAG TPA: thioesterase family protein [Syntrophomonadaceae bacterium]|nr:thioesterase family protein [Syntrophomonadaceae bacterium]